MPCWAVVDLENDYPLLSFAREFPFQPHRLQEQVCGTPVGKCALQDHLAVPRQLVFCKKPDVSNIFHLLFAVPS